jgi:hypothetical protein
MTTQTTEHTSRRRLKVGASSAEPADQEQTYTPAVDWLSLLLLVMTLLSVAWSVNAAGWANGLYVLQAMVVGGALLGFALSHSRWNGFVAFLHALVTGLAWITFWVSRLLASDFGPRERVYQLFAGVALWVQRVVQGASGTGSLIFVLLLAIVSWWMAVATAWARFRRRSAWQAIVPVGILLLLNLYYAPARLSIYFLLFAFCALILAIRANLAQREAGWRAAGMRYAMDIGFDFVRDGVIFAVLVLALAYFVPAAGGQGGLDALVKPLERPWERVKEEWQRLFNSLQYPSQPGYAAFGRSLTLSGPVSLGDTVIMDIRAPAARYWRALVYHTYTGVGWLNDDNDAVPLGAGETPRMPTYLLTQQITQTVTTYYPGSGILFASGQPQRSVSPAMAAVKLLPEEAAPTPTPMPGGAQRATMSPPLDISMLFSRSRLRVGDTYTVVSAISTADVESLRQAGNAYPAWIRDRYLQAPDDLPQRVRDLAFQITSPYENAYDKAVALETYLRTELAYNEKIAPPPPGQDGVDYFLFGVREGYCDYYASAMSIMARAVGIPARLAAGYSQGELDPQSGLYRIRELNAHAWVEVFFPSYGWLEFEPTANEPVIVRPARPPEGVAREQSEALASMEDEEKFGPEPLFGEGVGGVLRAAAWPLSLPWTIALGVSVLLLAAGLAGWWLLRRRPPSLASSPLTQHYLRLVEWGERLRLKWQPHQTVYEQAGALTLAVPEGQAHIDQIARLYVLERFSPLPAGQADLESASRSWSLLRPMLWRHWLRRLSRPEGLMRWYDRWSRRLSRQFPG